MGINMLEARQSSYLLDSIDRRLVSCIQAGLPLSQQPYAEVGKKLDLSEAEVMQRLQHLQEIGVIKRLGVVVRHRELGYRANAMVVWDVADNKIDEVGCLIRQFESVTLCYQRPRRLPDWSYNLFCMIHGHDRQTVLASLQQMIERYKLQDLRHEVLFSRRRFKQCGANYAQPDKPAAEKESSVDG